MLAIMVLVGLAVLPILPGQANAAHRHAAQGSTAHGSTAHPMQRGFQDFVWWPPTSPIWIPRTVATGAQVALIEVDWTGIEPTAPKTKSDASNPNAPNFAWGGVDGVLRRFENTGISVALFLVDAPSWAEAPGGPTAEEASGAWKPNVAAFGGAARALALRYSGSTPDPNHPGRKLPRVRYFQAWAEANIGEHLAPQWSKVHGKWVPAAPVYYRQMLNAFYAGVKSVNKSDVVMTAGMAPYGDGPGGDRMHPVTFMSSLLCLPGKGIPATKCPNPAHFDVYASDPYEVGSPTTHAYSPLDVSAPDLGRLTRLVDKAVSGGKALPRVHKHLWVTEFSYDSNPPNPNAISIQEQARWLEESFYVFWHEGVNTAIWYLVRDNPGHNYKYDYFSGVYYYDGKPKPSFTAYRFPFVVMNSTAWGISPVAGKLAVQRKQGGSWHTIFHEKIKADGVFAHPVSSKLTGDFRATVSGQSSLVWKSG
jgi:hypothetical protein